MAQDTHETAVIFRKFSGGDVIALFPELPGTLDPYTCESYMRIGQHGSADCLLTRETRRATPDDYAPLLRELQAIGYRPRVVQRMTRHHLAARRAELAELRAVAQGARP